MHFEPTNESARDFIQKWKGSEGGELAESQSYLLDLCDLIGVEHPLSQVQDPEETYKFERSVTFHHADSSTSNGRVDLYKRGCFVLESKQGTERNIKKSEQSEIQQIGSKTSKKNRTGTAVRNTGNWDSAMVRARAQAESYAKALPAEEGWPPFLIVVDVGHDMHLYADFSQQGKNYVQFPDAQGFRIKIDHLARENIRSLLYEIWTNPLSLDPSAKSAKVTKEIADHLAVLAKSLEASGHHPESVSAFLMRSIFTMFAEDVELLKKGSFTHMLINLKGQTDKGLVPMLEALWRDMDKGTEYSIQLQDKILRFNGYLFKERTAIKLNEEQLDLLIEAAEADWRHVEPAIFGTLLERALDPHERHKLGAHYTPRAYVERLIIPTVVEPLKEDWADIQATAEMFLERGDKEKAKKTVRDFHAELCEVKILDPACGSANFLYVTMEHMKRLEGEVIEVIEALGDTRPAFTVDPHQFLGIELNPRATKIAETVLWIGYLQWHFRTFGKTAPAEPVLKDFHNIENRDAILDWDERELVRDQSGEPISIWDGRTTKTHPVTGKEIPDDTARNPIYRYINPRAATWPKADFIIGNPPFIGQQRMRRLLGDGYVDGLHHGIKNVGKTADFVMYWWHKAATLLANKKARYFGLVTTNSITQKLNQNIILKHTEAKNPISIIFAIPNHPWGDDTDQADVRISMSVCKAGMYEGRVDQIIYENSKTNTLTFDTQFGYINENLKIGVNPKSCDSLMSNEGLAIKGFELGSQGFLITNEVAERWIKEDSKYADILYKYFNGNDFKKGISSRYVIDFHGLNERKSRAFQRAYNHVILNVKETKNLNSEARVLANWWLFRRSGHELRNAKKSLTEIIGTTRTSRHRIFQKCSSESCLESGVVTIALKTNYFLGVLSSKFHVIFSTNAGGRLGVGDDPIYNHMDCFNKYPFPLVSTVQKNKIESLAEELDALRKARLLMNPDLTLTTIYNVLEKLKAGEELDHKERDIHERAQVSILKHLHDEIDKAVAEAYGWPHDIGEEEILSHLVDLNKHRAAEEERGLIRWLRPDFQNPSGTATKVQESLDTKQGKTKVAKTKKPAWPKDMPEQVRTVRAILSKKGKTVSAKELANIFSRGKEEKVSEVLDALVALGQAQELDGQYRI